MNLLNNITTFKGERSRAVSPENPTGEKGRACMEDSALGPQRKGRGSIRLPMGEETVIADIKGPGIIRHIWMTIRENTEVLLCVMLYSESIGTTAALRR